MLELLSLSKKVFGLEITDINIRLMKLVRRRGRLFVAAAGDAALEEDTVRDGFVKDEKKLSDAIRKLMARVAGGKKETRYAVISLPETKSFLQVIAMPRLNPEELRAAVVFEAENYIPLPLEKVYLDFEKVAPAADNAPQCEVLVAALPKEIVDSRVRVIDMAGLTPVAMELESQAVARALREERDLKSPTMIIQIGDTRSNVIFYSRNSIRFTFSIPISNRYFIETIAANAKVGAEQAELLKSKCGIEEFARTAGTGLPPAAENSEKRKIFEALIPGLVDFAQQIQKCAQYYQTHEETAAVAEKKNFDKVFICGSGSNLKGLDEFLALKLGAPVEQVVLPIGIDSSISKKVNFLGDDAHGSATVAGLAIRALGIESGAAEEPAPPAAAPKKTLRQKIKVNK